MERIPLLVIRLAGLIGRIRVKKYGRACKALSKGVGTRCHEVARGGLRKKLTQGEHDLLLYTVSILDYLLYITHSARLLLPCSCICDYHDPLQAPQVEPLARSG